MAAFSIVLQTAASLHPGGEPSDFVSEYAGVITCTDDESGAVTKVGRVAARRVHAARAHDAGESLHAVCDCHSAELEYLHALLYEPERYHFREEVLARFDAADPDLLVLDEPFQGLDAATVRRARDWLDTRLRADQTLVFVSHHPDEIPACVTRRLRLDAGRVVGTV